MLKKNTIGAFSNLYTDRQSQSHKEKTAFLERASSFPGIDSDLFLRALREFDRQRGLHWQLDVKLYENMGIASQDLKDARKLNRAINALCPLPLELMQAIRSSGSESESESESVEIDHRYTRPLFFYEKALALAQVASDEDPRVHAERVAELCRDIGRMYAKQAGMLRRADLLRWLRLSTRELEIRSTVLKNDGRVLARLLQTVARINQHVASEEDFKLPHRMAEAAKSWEKRARILEKAHKGPDLDAADAFESAADAYQAHGMFAEALRLLEIARDFLVCILGKSHSRVDSAYSKLGFVHLALGNLDSSLAMHECSLRIRTNEALFDAASRLELEALARESIGRVYFAKGERARALEAWQRCIKLWSEPEIADLFQVHIAMTYEKMANAHRLDKDFS